MSVGILKNFFRGWRQQPAAYLATLSVLIGSFTILMLCLLVQQNLSNILSRWGRETKVTVYLKETNDPALSAQVKKQIEDARLFSNIIFFSKSEALQNFKQRIGEYAPGLLSDLEKDNPLPASFELTVENQAGSRNLKQIMDWAKSFKNTPGIDEVSYGQGWIENYASLVRVFSVTSWLFIFVVLAGSLFVIGNSIRSSLAQRRDEIEILELFGATRSMVLWPYVFEGLLLGFTASLAALATTYLLYTWQTGAFISELTFLDLKSQFEFLSLASMLFSIIGGTSLGGLGSYFWARSVNSGWAAAEAVSRWAD
jgi:cell division transport system permease protein